MHQNQSFKHRQLWRYVLVCFRRAIYALVLLLLVVLIVRHWPHASLQSMRPQSTAVFAADGSLMRLALANDERYRLWLPLIELPSDLIEAVKLKEDRYFDWHPGVNPISLLRSAWQVVTRRETRTGASTLTMQLVRLRDRSNTKSFGGKFTQILDALWMSARHSKAEVLNAYLNFAPYGGNVEGVAAASLIYFNKPVQQLNLPEVLTLAVLPQRPVVRCDAKGDCLTLELRQARQRLFEAWLKTHPQDARWQAVLDAPMPLRKINALPFFAPHASEYVLADALGRAREPNHVLQTTIEPRLQRLVQQQIDRYLSKQSSLGLRNAAAIVLDTRDMSVRAMIGSQDYFNASIHGQVNGVLAKRSPGSTLKPFLYALAIDQGRLHPATVLRDVPTAFGGFTPENFDGQFMGPVTAEQALIRSRNIPAVNIAARLSQPNLYQFLRDAGVQNMASESHYGLALVLGGGEVTMLELARLYAMLSNDGVLKPLRLLQSEVAVNGTQMLSAEASFIVRDMLQKNPRPDSGKSRLPVAWKTGTSWGFHDAWTAGMFGPYVVIVWLGNFDNTPNPALIGVQSAAPLFFQISDAILNDDSNLREPPRRWPLNLKRVAVCSASGDLPNALCPNTNETWFIPGKSPIKISTLHRAVVLDPNTGKVICNPTSEQSARQQVFEYWPSDLAEVFRQAGLPRVTPPSTAHCQMGMRGVGSDPQIISPRRGATYLLPLSQGSASERADGAPSTMKNRELDQSTIILQATVDADARMAYWFADGQLIDSSAANAKLEWRPPTAGRFQIRVTDDHGRSDERWVEVGSR